MYSYQNITWRPPLIERGKVLYLEILLFKPRCKKVFKCDVFFCGSTERSSQTAWVISFFKWSPYIYWQYQIEMLFLFFRSIFKSFLKYLRLYSLFQKSPTLALFILIQYLVLVFVFLSIKTQTCYHLLL